MESKESEAVFGNVRLPETGISRGPACDSVEAEVFVVSVSEEVPMLSQAISVAREASACGCYGILRRHTETLGVLACTTGCAREATRKEVQRLKMDRAELLAKLSSQQQAEGPKG